MPISNDRFHWISRQAELWNLTDVETMDLAVAREQFHEARAVLNEILNVARQDNRSPWTWLRDKLRRR
jgi:hypothetical protein